MKIREIHVHGYNGFFTKSVLFNPDVSIIVGANGSGKSILCRLLDMVCGTRPLEGEPIDWLRIVLEIDGAVREETFRHVLGENVEAFRERLPVRLNHVLDDGHPITWVGAENACPRSVAMTDAFLHEHEIPYRSLDPNRLRCGADKIAAMGYRMKHDVPTIIDNPDDMLDISVQRGMLRFLTSWSGQLIFASHSPCFVAEGWDRVLEMP